PNVGSGTNLLAAVSFDRGNDGWAVGTAYPAGVGQTLAMRWNGTAWKGVPTPNIGSDFDTLHGVAAISRTNAWAVGSDTNIVMEQWDGTGWTLVTPPDPGSVANNLTAVSADGALDVWAVGIQVGSDFIPRTLVEH